MAEIRVILGDDDRENEEFLGFDLDNIEETEEFQFLLGVASMCFRAYSFCLSSNFN
jgi:hypothetical protein